MPQPAYLEISTTDNERFTSVAISRPGVPGAMIPFPLSLIDNPHLDPKSLMTAIEKFNEEVAAMVKRLSPAGFEEQVEDSLKGIAAALRAYLQKTRTRKQEVDESWINRLMPPKDIDAARLAETRAYLRSLKSVADVTRVVLSDDIAAFAALQSPEGIMGMNDPAIRGHVERLAVMSSLRRVYAAQPGMTKKPTLEEPLANGVDEQAVEKAASAALQAHEQWLADIAAASKIIQQTVMFYAIAANITPRTAFENMKLGG